MQIREAVAQGNTDLKFAGIKSPGLDSSLLMAHVLNVSRESLTANSNKKLTEKQCADFCELIERRASGECVAYILGKKEFRGLEFLVNKSVLVPRPDTETLVETALKMCNDELKIKNKLRILDLCTGSGAVAIAIKNEMPELEVHASDISTEALEVASSNSKKLLGDKKLYFYQGDLYEALKTPFHIPHSSFSTPHSSLSTPQFSIITANPPYISSDEMKTLQTEVQNEPSLALDGGRGGLEIITRIINDTPEFLEKGGSLLMEADPRQMNEISILLDKKGFSGIKLYKDLSGLNRVIGGQL